MFIPFRNRLLVILLVFSSLLATACQAQHLWWDYKQGASAYTRLYGEITVYSTSKTIYYCGCNWWPGAPAGGYTGIQDAGPQGDGTDRHLMIFSIWDTSDTLHPSVVQQDARAVSSRFGGEGTGGHTHLDYAWPMNHVYRYYATKSPDPTGMNTLTKVFFYDEGLHKWVKEATISNPIGGFDSVTSFGGGLNAFLENWSGEDRAKPKLATYRLWLGTSAADLMPVTSGGGDGKWGVLNGAFYLAEGDDGLLAPVFEAAKGPHGTIVVGAKEKLPIPTPRLSGRVRRDLAALDKD